MCFIKTTATMKRIIYYSFLSVIFFLNSSCITTQVTPHEPFLFKNPNSNSLIIDRSLDDVWNSVVDFFAGNNLNIKIIDKSSGLIISERSYFPSEYVTSNIPKETSYMAVQFNKIFKADGTGMRCSAEWNVRVTKIDDNKTLVVINIGNPIVELNMFKGSYTVWERSELQSASTGNFEKFIFSNIVKKK